MAAVSLIPETFTATVLPKLALTGVFGAFIGIILLAAGALAIIYLVWSGIQYVTAGGAADKMKAARQGIVNAVIGIIVITSTYGVIRLAQAVGTQINDMLGGSAVISGVDTKAGGGATDGIKDTATGEDGTTSPSGPPPTASAVACTAATIGTTQLNGIFKCAEYGGAKGWYVMTNTDAAGVPQSNFPADGTALASYQGDAGNSVPLSAGYYWKVPTQSGVKWCLSTDRCITTATMSVYTGFLVDATIGTVSTEDCTQAKNIISTASDTPPDLTDLYHAHCSGTAPIVTGGGGTASYHSPSYYDGDSAGCAAAGDDYVEVNPDGTESTDCRASAPASYVDEGDLAGSKARCEAAGYDWTDPKTTYDAEGNPTTTGASCT